MMDIAALFECVWHMLADSVEEGEKIVNAAVDNFGRIGKTLLISLNGRNFAC